MRRAKDQVRHPSSRPKVTLSNLRQRRNKAATLSGCKIDRCATMKTFSAITLLAIFAVIAVISSSVQAAGHESHLRVRRATGCPDFDACLASCKKEGHRGGYCMIPFYCVCM
ncbi:hypothetical protein MTO96_025549 [Rhipicephalus appendiculatus]